MNMSLEIGRVQIVQIKTAALRLRTSRRVYGSESYDDTALCPTENTDAYEFALELYHRLGNELRCAGCGFVPEPEDYVAGSAYCRKCQNTMPPLAELTDEEVKA
jgi:hypothetical protein